MCHPSVRPRVSYPLAPPSLGQTSNLRRCLLLRTDQDPYSPGPRHQHQVPVCVRREMRYRPWAQVGSHILVLGTLIMVRIATPALILLVLVLLFLVGALCPPVAIFAAVRLSIEALNDVSRLALS